MPVISIYGKKTIIPPLQSGYQGKDYRGKRHLSYKNIIDYGITKGDNYHTCYNFVSDDELRLYM